MMLLNKFKNKLARVAALLILALPVFIPASVGALDSCPGGTGSCPSVQSSLCSGAGALGVSSSDPTGGECKALNDANGGETKVNKLIKQIINVFSVIVGVVAVIMIIFAGFKYITSGGKEEGVKTAKNTILYALIGLVIVALAQIIVKFVLNKATA